MAIRAAIIALATTVSLLLGPSCAASCDNDRCGEISVNIQLSAIPEFTQLSNTTVVRPRQGVTIRLRYNNRGSFSLKNASIVAPLSRGITVIPDTTKNCIQPSTSEVRCNTELGQSGPISEDAVWRSSTLMIAPTAGLYGVPGTATSGILETGKLRYLNAQNCDYARDDGRNTDDIAGFAPANTPRKSLSCGAGTPGSVHFRPANSQLSPGDLFGKQFVNAENCDYVNRVSGNTEDTFTVAPSNEPIMSLHCSAGSSAAPLREGNSWFASVSHLGYRYLNFQDCDYLAGINTDDVFELRASNTPRTSLACVQSVAPGGLRSENSVFQAIDLLDRSRGGGYIEFKVMAPSAAGTYFFGAAIFGENEVAGVSEYDDSLAAIRVTAR